MDDDTFKYGEHCKKTGTYLHTGCNKQTADFDRGDDFAPCQNKQCPNIHSPWKFLRSK